LEFGTLRFRDPLNKERRFLPLRLDDASLKAALEQFVRSNLRFETGICGQNLAAAHKTLAECGEGSEV